MSGYEQRLRHTMRPKRRIEMDERVRSRCQRRLDEQRPPKIPTLAEIADPENLIDVYGNLKRENGHAPGPDGVTFKDLSHREVCEIMRDLSPEILADRYQASHRRMVSIAKRGGGHRELSIRSLIHRVVGAALNEALAPYWESIYLNNSYGFRRGLNTWNVLVGLEHAVEQGCTVISQDDVYHAFDEIHIPGVMEAHRQYIQDEQLESLIEAVLRDPYHTNTNQTKGVDQGGPYSPTALNVLLHAHLDSHLSESADFPFWFRYADNLIVATQKVSEGWKFLDQARQLLLPISLTLKGKDGPPVDLSHKGTDVTILGFVIRLEGNKLNYELQEDAWLDLEEGLQEAYGYENPPYLAKEVIRGWIQARGPVFENRWDPVLSQVLQIAARNGYREVPYKDVKGWIQSAWDRWCHIKDGVHQQLSTIGDPVESVSPTTDDVSGHHAMPEAGLPDTVSGGVGYF